MYVYLHTNYLHMRMHTDTHAHIGIRSTWKPLWLRLWDSKKSELSEHDVLEKRTYHVEAGGVLQVLVLVAQVFTVVMPILRMNVLQLQTQTISHIFYLTQSYLSVAPWSRV